MNKKNQNPFLNIAVIHKKALKAGIKIGFFAALLGILGGVLIVNAFHSGYTGNAASQARLVSEALIMGPITGLIIGFMRSAYIWLSILARAYRRSVVQCRKDEVVSDLKLI